MADAVTSQTIQDGERKAVLKFTNISDGTGETNVVKVDVSALTANSAGKSCSKVTVAKIWWQCVGMGVELLCDACLLYTSPSPRDVEESRMPSSA